MSNGLMWVIMIGMTVVFVLVFQFSQKTVQNIAAKQNRRYFFSEVQGMVVLVFFVLAFIAALFIR